jgi:HEAT repeat protein
MHAFRHSPRPMQKSRPGLAVLTIALCWMAGPAALAAAERSDLLPMVLELLNSPDRDTRGLALTQIREGLPGATLTARFSELLPTLAAESQAALLDALGERGDAAARPGVINAMQSPAEPVRVSALRALGRLGNASDVPLLAQKAGLGSDRERVAARGSLIQLKSDHVDDAITACLTESCAAIRAAVLPVLAARRQVGAMPQIVRCARDSQREVRLAALAAAASLARGNDARALIEILASSADAAERDAAEAALLAVSARERESSLDALLAAWATANGPTRVCLIRACAAAGGSRALRKIAEASFDPTLSVADEAVRVLSDWPDPAAAPVLLEIARKKESPVRQVLALRGLVRLAAGDDKAATEPGQLTEVWNLASRPEERRLVLGLLGSKPTGESLRLASLGLDDPLLAEEAALAVVQIGEKRGYDTPGLRPILEKAREHAGSLALRERLDTLLAVPTKSAPGEER